MSNVENSPGIRKKISLKFGRKTVRLNIGHGRELFTVHEELLCVLPFFRDILQPRRKPIKGDCSICHEVLDATVKELTYCSSSCGGNFHRNCIEEWTICTTPVVYPRCPLCKQRWTLDDDATLGIHRLPTLNADAFDIFFGYLYTSHIILEDVEDSIDCLCQAHIMGTRFGAVEFCEQVLRTLIKEFVEQRKMITRVVISRLYANTSGPCALRRFLVGLLTQWHKDNFEGFMDGWDVLPDAFKRDLIEASMKKCHEYRVPWEVETLTAELLEKSSSNDAENEEGRGTES